MSPRPPASKSNSETAGIPKSVEPDRLPLVERIAGEVCTELIQNRRGKGAGPANRPHIVIGLQREILDGTHPTVHVVQSNDIRADEKLIVPLGVVNTSVVLIALARVGLSDIKNSPIRNAVRPIANGLTDPNSGRIPATQAIAGDQRAAIGRRSCGRDAGQFREC